MKVNMLRSANTQDWEIILNILIWLFVRAFKGLCDLPCFFRRNLKIISLLSNTFFSTITYPRQHYLFSTTATEQDLERITAINKNMKAWILETFDKLILRKRSIIENIFNLEHSRHRSLTNFAVNVVACLIAYSYQKKKPSLNIRRKDLLTIIA